MRRRRIIKEDGRYLIFYTFEDEPAPPEANVQPPEPKPEPLAEEERRV